MDETTAGSSQTGSEAIDAPSRAREMADTAGQIGHDLNNLIGVVGGRAELMLLYLDRGNLDGARKGVEVILGQMDRMRALSDSLRDFRKKV